MKRILFLIIICCASKVVFADVVFEFSGYIDQINENTNNAILDAIVGQPFNGWFSYSSVPDWLPDDMYGSYGQDASITVVLGTTTYSYIDKSVFIRVTDSSPYYNDKFRFSVDADLDEYINCSVFGIELTDSTSTAFDSDELPENLDLSAFDSTFFNMIGCRRADTSCFDVRGNITNLTLIPEPTMLLMLAFGGLVIRRKKSSY